ncbi:unnamed protein product [Amaranthus hypochondriacus]
MFPTSEELLIEGRINQKNCLKIVTENEFTKEEDSSSFTSSDLMEDDDDDDDDDATSLLNSPSTSCSSSSSSSNGPLFQLSDLMDQLPIKKGLSKYYGGKSESFTSLAKVQSLEDLQKKENPYKKNIKLYCAGFDSHKVCSPKRTIFKKSSNYYSKTASFTSTPKISCSNKLLLLSSCIPPNPLPTIAKDF